MLEVISTLGEELKFKISLTFKVSFFPSEPEGWYRAKSSDLNSLIDIRHMAIKSPISNCILVLVVGARLFGHASLSILFTIE